jgi:hypothetical protein
MEEVTDFLCKPDGLVCPGEVSGEWSVVITPHQRDEDKSKCGNTDEPDRDAGSSKGNHTNNSHTE